MVGIAEQLLAAEIKAYERTISQNLDAKTWHLTMAHRADVEVTKAERCVEDLRAAFDAVRTLR